MSQLNKYDPNDATAWYDKGLALNELERYEEAIGCYDTALKIDPKDATAWERKGLVLNELKRYEEAIGCYDKALKIDPKDAYAWERKGLSLSGLERYEEAISCYDKALEIAPKHAYAWYAKGLFLNELKRYEEAISCYDKALEIDPNYATAWYEKGLVLADLKRYEEAIGCYDKALEIDPKDAYAWYNKGFALANLKRYEEAISCCDKALKIKPNYERAKKYRGLVEEMLREQKEKEQRDEEIEIARMTSDYISSTESEITEIKSSGVKIPESSKNLIEQAKLERNENNFKRADELANDARKIALEIKEQYNLASDSLSASEKVFNEAKEFGCNVLDFEDRLTNVEQLFENGAYEEVIETSKQIGELVKKIREEAKPEIKISLSQTSFKPNAWKRIDNIITNTGTATAKEIKVEYPKERVEIEGLMAAEELKPNEEKTLKITIRPIHEGEVPLTATITYLDLDNKEYKGEQSFWITVGENVGEKGKQITTIEIKRSFVELPNNDLKFGIRIINNTEYMIADVKTILDYPRTLFSLKDTVVQTLANISPNGKRTAKYILTPLGCIHNEKIDAIISYNDHTGKKQTVQMRPKEVHCVCPFLKEKVIREGEFAELANTCERIEEGLAFSGIGVTELTVVIKESCAHRLYVISEHEIDAAKIVYLAGESIGEKAYYLLTAVIQPYKNLTQVALRAYSDKPYGLHGFLNEIASSIRYLVGSVQSAKEIGVIESKQVINIIDSVVQRTSFGGVVEGATTVNIEGSVVQRTEIGSLKRCPSCGKEVQTDEKFCKECRSRLE